MFNPGSKILSTMPTEYNARIGVNWCSLSLSIYIRYECGFVCCAFVWNT